MPGYEIKLGEVGGGNYPHSLSLCHKGISPVSMSIKDKLDLDHWVRILETYTNAEGSSRHKRISGKWISDSALAHRAITKASNGGKKGPVKANHNISGVKATSEVRILIRR